VVKKVVSTMGLPQRDLMPTDTGSPPKRACLL
jgi:hypothetical protein